MPVVTRSQAKSMAGGNPTVEVPEQPNLIQAVAKKSRRRNNSDGDELEVLTPHSHNGPLPGKSLALKPSAAKAPLSHPLADQTVDRSFDDSHHEIQRGGFTIPALQAPGATAIVIKGMHGNEAFGRPRGQSTSYVRPEDKLLKPLPAVPVESTKLPDGPEPLVVDIEYPATEMLQPVEGDANAYLRACLAALDASEWTQTCSGLLGIRRLARHHIQLCRPEFPQAVPRIVKSIRSLRSALSKTAIMTVRDLYLAAPDGMLPLTDIGGMAQPADSVLAQLLLKAASNDKKFVIDEAQRALSTMADTLVPLALLNLLNQYTQHKNPKLRGKVAGIVAICVGKLSPWEMYTYGLEGLLKMAARLLTDNTPEAREAAKKLAAAIRTAFNDELILSNIQMEPDQMSINEQEEENSQMSLWEFWCRKTLGAATAVTFLRVA